MTAEERIAQLAERLQQVEGRLAKDSHNSSKAPSSDGPARQLRSQRKASGKKTGGQAGHAGRTLLQAASPDEVLLHRPGLCAHCQQSLQGVPGPTSQQESRRPCSMAPTCAPWRFICTSTSWCRWPAPAELLADLCECHLSEGTLTRWVELAAAMLKETVEHIADWLSASRLTHGDETGVRIGGDWHLAALAGADHARSLEEL